MSELSPTADQLRDHGGARKTCWIQTSEAQKRNYYITFLYLLHYLSTRHTVA